MLKRTLALLLCFLTALALLPAVPVQAAVLSGWTSKVDYDNTDPNRYAIEIDLVNQVITVYEGAIGGPIAVQSLCTTGNAENPTGAGTYKLGSMKERFGYFVAFGQYAQYWTQVVRGIYIHSVMYNSTKLTSMSKSAYRDLGKNVSHGCVRVLPHVAQFIYYNCPPGTVCKIVRNKAKDEALVDSIKRGIPSYSNYQQPQDNRAWPTEIPGVIRYDGTPLRTGFSNSRDTTVATLGAGDQVMLLQLAEDWCKVRTQSGKLGYVKTPYLLAYPDAQVVNTTAYTAQSKTYVYAKMDTGSKKLIAIPSGAQVTVESNPQKGWWYGSYSGVTGYMRTKYVIKTTTVSYPVHDPATDGFTGTETIAPAPTPTPAPPTGSSSGLGSGGQSSTGSAGNSSGGSTGNGSLSGSGSLGGSTCIRTGIQANMRTGAGTDFPLIATLAGGTRVTILGTAGTWYYCEVNGLRGYIYANLVTTY